MKSRTLAALIVPLLCPAAAARADEAYYVPPPEPVAVVVAPAHVSPARAAVRRALLPFRRQIGLGARIVGAFGSNGYLGFGQGGVAIDVLLRGHPYLTTELSLQYLGTAPDGTGYARSDVPLLLSQRVSLRGPGRIVAPYVVAGVGASFARVQTPEVEEQGLFLDGQAGGGVEVRLGRFAALGADLRATGKLRVDGDARERENDREVLGSQLGVAASLTAAGYF